MFGKTNNSLNEIPKKISKMFKAYIQISEITKYNVFLQETKLLLIGDLLIRDKFETCICLAEDKH